MEHPCSSSTPLKLALARVACQPSGAAASAQEPCLCTSRKASTLHTPHVNFTTSCELAGH